MFQLPTSTNLHRDITNTQFSNYTVGICFLINKQYFYQKKTSLTKLEYSQIRDSRYKKEEDNLNIIHTGYKRGSKLTLKACITEPQKDKNNEWKKKKKKICTSIRKIGKITNYYFCCIQEKRKRLTRKELVLDKQVRCASLQQCSCRTWGGHLIGCGRAPSPSPSPSLNRWAVLELLPPHPY